MRVAEAEPKTVKPVSGDTRAGFFYALTAYLLWGFLPLYMKLLEDIDAFQVMAHRALWSLPVAGAILWWMGRTGDILPTLKSPKRLGILFLTATIISTNWTIYVWAISVERTLETALGYYINPLITVAMGAVFLGERFTRAQRLALAIATLAVVLLTLRGGVFPWISLVLAFTFATYGFLRKTVDVGPTQGFLVEVMLLAPFAFAFIAWREVSGQGAFFEGTDYTALLIGCGPVTAIPLILYAFGAKGLRLSTIGLMQYIAPTMIFLIGLFVFREPFSFWQAVAFVMIWAALAIYTWSAFRKPA
ncbi:EamA family transporter RarD [Salaquimonas pukyongi]|uniref:EamA family transporter RarD n=1 Tax=Salaquimonas pukyongi TaxID=2712698 RepID=UPI00096BB0EA|nr:EamA family transporter RarD [Salaquimonas pukyongi]